MIFRNKQVTNLEMFAWHSFDFKATSDVIENSKLNSFKPIFSQDPPFWREMKPMKCNGSEKDTNSEKSLNSDNHTIDCLHLSQILLVCCFFCRNIRQVHGLLVIWHLKSTLFWVLADLDLLHSFLPNNITTVSGFLWLSSP